MKPRKKISVKSSKSASVKKREMDPDRISNLPDAVTDHILSYLPIKDRVNTSLLSSKWRYKWATVPCLVFDDESFPVSTIRHGAAITSKLVSDIDRVLLLRSGPICKFELSYERTLPSNEIDKWILHLSRHPIKEFILTISNLQVYAMPSCIFSCQDLTHLDLASCFLKPPSTFKGFKYLKFLSLWSVTLDQDVLENLIASCPMLEELDLADLVGVNHFNINAPNLQSFGFEAPILDVSFKSTSRLVSFMVDATSRYKDYQRGNVGYPSNLIELLAEMPQIKSISIDGFSLEFLVHGVIPEELSVPCVNLRHMILYINLTSFNEASTLICLLRSTPNLQELQIKSSWNEECETGSNIWGADHWDRPFTRLRRVEISCFGGIQAEIDFISFMLLTSPLLSRMTVKLDKDAGNKWDYSVAKYKEKFEIVKQLLCLKRASPQAEILLMES